MKSKVLTALPAFIATVGGIAVYAAVRDGRLVSTSVVLILMFFIGVTALSIGKRMIQSHTLAGTLLIAAWILALIATGAFLTALFVWVGLRLPEWIAGGAASDEIKELSKVLLGAATAFVAVVFTDELDKAEGELWPSTKTRDAFEEAFEGKFTGGSPEYDAAFEERVRPRNGTPKVNGWGFVARVQRARIIESHRHGTNASSEAPRTT
jgi:hypothetical protein